MQRDLEKALIMTSDFLSGLDKVDWNSLGYPEMPNWLRDLASDNREIRLKAYHRIEDLIANAGSQSWENYGPISELLKTDMPIVIAPFLIDLLKNEDVSNKDLELQALDDIATYPTLIELTDDEIYKNRAKKAFEAVKNGVPVYEKLLSPSDNYTQRMAKQILENIAYQTQNKREDT